MSSLATLPIRWEFIAIGIAVSLVYALYRLALPTPLPGIPYNKHSAKRLLGDIPELVALRHAGDTPRRFWPELAMKYKSPIVQYFLGPFQKPAIVVSDFREAQYLMVKREKDFGRGVINREAWRGITPEHFIGMDDHDKRFNDTKGLLKDLMTPRFLHESNAPASYQKVLEFVELWHQKSKIAQGRPFDALQDLSALTYDVILAAAIGLDDTSNEAVAVRQAQRLQDDDISKLLPADNDTIFPFPDTQITELQNAVHVIAHAVGASFTQPSKRMFHFFNNRTASMKKAYHAKRTVLQSYIDRSSQRLAQEGENFQMKSALDYMVSREISLAKKAGRAPELDSLRFSDILFGYLIGGQDSTHSTLSFLLKHLEDNQESQQKLRAILREAYPEAAARREQPDLQDILKAQIPYLDAFIQEVLRVSDPTMVISKETLCDMDILGHLIPKGTIVVFCFSGPTYQEPGIPIPEENRRKEPQKQDHEGLADWTKSAFPAKEFWPERWLRLKDDESGSQVFDSQAGPFLPFSSGRRGCWGKKLAYLELKLVVTLLVWNFNFEPLPPQMNDWGLDDNLFVKPSSCHVRLSSALED